MMERLIGSLAAEEIGTITLYAEANVVGLYEKLSFIQDPQGIKVCRFLSGRVYNSLPMIPEFNRGPSAAAGTVYVTETDARAPELSRL